MRKELHIRNTIYRSIFKQKNHGSLQYLLGIEVAKSKREIILSHIKYVLDMLCEACLLGARLLMHS